MCTARHVQPRAESKARAGTRMWLDQTAARLYPQRQNKLRGDGCPPTLSRFVCTTAWPSSATETRQNIGHRVATHSTVYVYALTKRKPKEHKKPPQGKTSPHEAVRVSLLSGSMWTWTSRTTTKTRHTRVLNQQKKKHCWSPDTIIQNNSFYTIMLFNLILLIISYY